MSVWAYTAGGTKLGDRVMAMKAVMEEKGLHKEWNEWFTLANRAIGGNVTLSGGRTTFGEIDMAATGDVTTVIPKQYEDPFRYRQMPGYPNGQVQEVPFGGFLG